MLSGYLAGVMETVQNLYVIQRVVSLYRKHDVFYYKKFNIFVTDSCRLLSYWLAVIPLCFNPFLYTSKCYNKIMSSGSDDCGFPANHAKHQPVLGFQQKFRSRHLSFCIFYTEYSSVFRLSIWLFQRPNKRRATIYDLIHRFYVELTT